MAKKSLKSISCEKQSYLITADTIVTVGKRLLVKTYDEIKAEEYLNCFLDEGTVFLLLFV